MLKSINDIDLSPKPGKTYYNEFGREWREEFIYFLLVDRFHDDHPRNGKKSNKRQGGFGSGEELRTTCGGTLRGVTNHLDYIKDLGCTALWLSPVFENPLSSYHGYAIQNFLEVDKRFGTKQDLEELVSAAHALGLRVYLDIVLHHSADTWYYPNDQNYYYYEGAVFPFGGWRDENLPLPKELRNPELYWKKGQIRNYDAFPETREGDFENLKSFRNDNSPEALYVLETLINIHCYWIRETDIDGFRLDAVKHMSEESISRFCSYVREYAYKLGKKNLFVFGEVVGSDEMNNIYFGPKHSTVENDMGTYYGLNSVLDFPLYHVLADVIKGKAAPVKLFERYKSIMENSVHRSESEQFMVTFIDNHDQVGQAVKKRVGYEATERQVISGIGFLLCALGIPCIYYGTEQGFDGNGIGDWNVREAMFSLTDKVTNALNKNNPIYKEIAKLATLRQQIPALRFGRMSGHLVSENGKDFRMPIDDKCLIVFSRILFDDEILIAYNPSMEKDNEMYVEIDTHINHQGRDFHFLYGQTGVVQVLRADEGYMHFIKLKLAPTQFVILSNQDV